MKSKFSILMFSLLCLTLFSFLDVKAQTPNVTINGKTPSAVEPQVFCTGTEDIMFTGHYDGQTEAFEWQYLDNSNVWQVITLDEMPTANTDNLNFIPTLKFRETKIRFAVYLPNTTEPLVSNAFPIQVYKTNEFIQQPPNIVNLCKGERFFITVNFNGEPILEANWYKDGYILPGQTEPMLDFTNVTNNHAGIYYYVVKAFGCKGLETIVSEKVNLFINPEPEIINVMTRVRTNVGNVGILKVEANYSIDVKQKDAFQWYRHDAITNKDIKLTDEYNILGTNSNNLILTNINDNNYTYNGDFYFCELRAMCGTGKAKSNPIYLIPGADLTITKQPVNFEICRGDLPKVAKFQVQAFSSEDNSKIIYQWFEGNKELLDNTEFSGVNSSILNVQIDGTPRDYEQFTCKVWYIENDPTKDFLMTQPVKIIIKDVPLVAETSKNTVDMKEGEELTLFVKISNPENEIYKWVFTDENNLETVLPETKPELKIKQVTLAQKGTYRVTVINGCGTVDVNFIVNVEPEQVKMNNVSEDIIISSVSVLPNPTTDHINFSFEAKTENTYSIEILDLNGALIYELNGNSNAATNTVKIDLAKLNLTNGYYFINLKIKDNVIHKSFIISK